MPNAGSGSYAIPALAKIHRNNSYLSLFFPDLSSWNGSISQRWRRLRRCCASLRTSSAQNSPEPCRDSLLEDQNKHILVSTPHGSSSLRLPNSKKGSVQDVLRSKLNRIHVGLRKRRALSVQEVFSSPTHEQPTFYVPSPAGARVPECNSPDSGPLRVCDTPQRKASEGHRSRSRTRYTNNATTNTPDASANDYGYQSCDSQGYDSLPFEPEPDYDDSPWNGYTTPTQICARRWSVVDGLIRYKNSHSQPQPAKKPEAPTPPEKPTTKVTLDNISNKIPKAKLSSKNQERARSHSPAKKTQKDHAKSIANLPKECDVRGGAGSKVVPSRSHYEFTRDEQRPEAGQNGEYGRINKEHRQVRRVK